jgi:hypothetical protein
MKKTGYFFMISFGLLLLTIGTTSFAFECAGPANQNCLQCHGGAGGETSGDEEYIHHNPSAHNTLYELGMAGCFVCHCGEEGSSPCAGPSWGTVETYCCTTCHSECYGVQKHVARGGDCAECHTQTNIGIDDDCDGICNPDVSDLSCTGSDNCPDHPNGPSLGTCTSGVIGQTCVSDELCGPDGVCSNSQEDTYPPGGNDIGDVCDCEANFDCDEDVDAEDVTTFLNDFGRNAYSDPCEAGNQCKGDFSCDGDVDAEDVTTFLNDFGRNAYSNPCPTCEVGDWCEYL